MPGDYVEAEVVHVIMPQFADDYYGPNTNLAQALQVWENTWQMVYREAIGNALDIKLLRGGKLVREYPIQIRSTGGDIRFAVTGGLGYVPVTFTDLTEYRSFHLEQKINGDWVEIDQSHYGKDFWQTDYNPETARWEITYSLPLDTADDDRIQAEFRLVKE